jgi:hypothetical protein
MMVESLFWKMSIHRENDITILIIDETVEMGGWIKNGKIPYYY